MLKFSQLDVGNWTYFFLLTKQAKCQSFACRSSIDVVKSSTTPYYSYELEENLGGCLSTFSVCQAKG